METLALMLAAVGLSLLVGIPLGIVAGRSDRFRRAITPVLDAMQIVPAFAYLMPVVILFSIGSAAAVVSTMIYAIPPAIRSRHSIEGSGQRRGGHVDGATLEAVASQGQPPRPADDLARCQPDDPFALDGRDRRFGRRRRPGAVTSGPY
jgi:glycine betaine/proline transport system permease protein